MTEKKIVVQGVSLSYEGYFDPKYLFNVIKNFTDERGYDWYEDLNEVIVKEDRRHMTLDLKPRKTISDYVKTVIQIKVAMNDITDEEIVLDGKKLMISRGAVKVTMNGIMFSDCEGDWNSKPWMVFINTVKDKFIYRDYQADFEGKLRKDIYRLKNEISAFLNLNKYR